MMNKGVFSVLLVVIVLLSAVASAHPVVTPAPIQNADELFLTTTTGTLVFFEPQDTSGVKVCYFTANPITKNACPMVFSFNVQPVKDNSYSKIAWGVALPMTASLQVQFTQSSFIPNLINSDQPLMDSLTCYGWASIKVDADLRPGWSEPPDRPPRTS